MSQFYASIRGSRGEATQMGSKASGIHGHIKGWNVGARVEMIWNDELKREECHIILTGGSNGGGARSLGWFYKNSNGEIVSA